MSFPEKPRPPRDIDEILAPAEVTLEELARRTRPLSEKAADILMAAVDADPRRYGSVHLLGMAKKSSGLRRRILKWLIARVADARFAECRASIAEEIERLASAEFADELVALANTPELDEERAFFAGRSLRSAGRRRVKLRAECCRITNTPRKPLIFLAV